MITYTSYTLPTYYYYSSFFPERHFNSSEEAINFEKKIALSGLHNKLRFYSRNYENNRPVAPAPWQFDHRDNYFHSTNNTPGFTEIPYTYRTKKCFIKIEEDKVVYRFFNEETQQYESEIVVQPQSTSKDYYEFYKYENGYMVPVEDYFSWGNHELFVYSDFVNMPSIPPIDEGKEASYFFVPNDGVYKWNKSNKKYDFISNENLVNQSWYNNIYFYDTKGDLPTGKNETGKVEYAFVEESTIQTNDYRITFYSSLPESTEKTYGLPCDTKGNIKEGRIKSFGNFEKQEYIPLYVLFLPTENLAVNAVYLYNGNYYYCSNGTWYKLYSDKNNDPTICSEKDFKVASSPNSDTFYYCGGAFHQYISEDSKGIYCRNNNETEWNLYTGSLNEKLFRYTLSPIESYLAAPVVQNDKWYVKVCRAIYKAAATLWKALRKAGSAIKNFFSTLWSWLKGETYYGTEINFYWGNTEKWDSIEVNKYEGTYYISNEKKVYQIATNDGQKVWVDITRNANVGNVSRVSDIIRTPNTYWIVARNSKCYKVEKDGSLTEIPTLSKKPNLDLKTQKIYYSEETKKCYTLNENLYVVEAPQYTDFTELYEAADAIRLVLNYDDDIYSTAFKNFNHMIQVLNEELGYSFPTNTNTVQPTGSNEGDWGFYFYDKYQGWITGREAHELSII